jgi:hypothetical protein
MKKVLIRTLIILLLLSIIVAMPFLANFIDEGYYPILAGIGSITFTIFLFQSMYWWHHAGDKATANKKTKKVEHENDGSSEEYLWKILYEGIVERADFCEILDSDNNLALRFTLDESHFTFLRDCMEIDLRPEKRTYWDYLVPFDFFSLHTKDKKNIFLVRLPKTRLDNNNYGETDSVTLTFPVRLSNEKETEWIRHIT